MNNDKLEVSRELLVVIETFISAQADSFPKINVPRGMRSEGLDHVSKELRALLAKPVARPHSDTNLVDVISREMNRLGYGFHESHAASILHVVQKAQNQGDPVAVLYTDGSVLTKAECGISFDVCCKVETPLYSHPAEQPAPVSVVLPSIDAVMKLVFDYQLNKNKNVTGTTNWAANIGMAVIDEVKRLNP